MAKPDNEIRSTEKLLELIRSPNSNASPDDSEPSAEIHINSGDKPWKPSLSFQKKITIGVDIGHTHIRLAKVRRGDKSHELLDYLNIPFSKSISIKDDKIIKHLKSALDKFCEGMSGFDIWGAIQSANVETHCIRIPKLPRKQIPNAIYWTFTKKAPFDKNLEILDYENLGEISEGGLKKIQVLVFKAPKNEIQVYKNAFQTIGYPLKGISIAPFAIQNLFRTKTIPFANEDNCCLFIGRDWSRIAIYSQGNLVLSRGIKAGMRSMVEAINIALNKGKDWDSNPQSITLEDENEVEQSSLAVNPRAQKLFFDLIGTSPSADPVNDQIDQSRVFQMILPAMERLIRQVERTFEHYTLNFNTEGVKQVFISGQVIANPSIIDHFSNQLDLPVIPMNPFQSNGDFTGNVRIPDSVSEREGFVPAIGLALSSNAITPNFLFTHEDKEAVESIRRNNMRILTACMLCLMIMIGVFSWQQKQLDARRIQIEKLDNQLLTYNPPVEKELLIGLYNKTKDKRQTLAEIVRRYTPVAIVKEISQITPSNIRLLDIDATFAQADPKSAKSTTRMITIEGIVFGDTTTFETSLTSYLLSLKNSPVFQRPTIQNKQIEYYNNQEVMRFITRLEII